MSLLIKKILLLAYPFFQRWMPYDVFAYLAVGALNTAVNILMFVLLYEWILPQAGWAVLHLTIPAYTLALIIAFFTTLPSGFWLSKTFAFSDTKSQKPAEKSQFIKYCLVVAQGLGSDYLLLIALIHLLGFPPSLAKILSTGMVLSVNFLLQKYFTFRELAN